MFPCQLCPVEKRSSLNAAGVENGVVPTTAEVSVPPRERIREKVRPSLLSVDFKGRCQIAMCCGGQKLSSSLSKESNALSLSSGSWACGSKSRICRRSELGFCMPRLVNSRAWRSSGTSRHSGLFTRTQTHSAGTGATHVTPLTRSLRHPSASEESKGALQQVPSLLSCLPSRLVSSVARPQSLICTSASAARLALATANPPARPQRVRTPRFRFSAPLPPTRSRSSIAPSPPCAPSLLHSPIVCALGTSADRRTRHLGQHTPTRTQAAAAQSQSQPQPQPPSHPQSQPQQKPTAQCSSQPRAARPTW